jgi:hypothetical protein
LAKRRFKLGLTTCCKEDEPLGAKKPSEVPEYDAEIVCVPTVRFVTGNFAMLSVWLVAVRANAPKELAPSKKVTEPNGASVAEVTVAVNVTG